MTGSPLNGEMRARAAAAMMQERAGAGSLAPLTLMLRATPDVEKLIKTRTGPPRSPQLRAAPAT